MPVISTNLEKTVNDMEKYRKKPVTIEAVQFTGLNPTEIKNFVGDNCEVEIYDNEVTPPVASIVIHTLEGDMEVSKGDYVIKGVKDEFYPCKPDIFEQTYESDEPDKSLAEEVKQYYSDNFAYISSNQPTLSILTNIARHFAEWQKEKIITLIQSRIGEILGDAQPKPALRAELEELIEKIKEDEE